MVSVSKSTSFSKGNVIFELNLQKYSIINELGEFINTSRPTEITFSEIPNNNGYISKYLYNVFQFDKL